MNFEYGMDVTAPIDRVWELLLDPKVMAGCVPGTQEVEVISETEYLAVVKVKISFISAKFKIKTNIVETRAPMYLRCEGTGEDKLVSSAMKQVTELHLTDRGDGTTGILVQTKADVLGRLGSFGLSVMKTKADRMWEEFGDNFRAIAEAGRFDAVLGSAPAETIEPAVPNAGVPQPAEAPTSTRGAPSSVQPIPAARPARVQTSVPTPAKSGWWPWGRAAAGTAAGSCAPISEQRLPSDIYIELHRNGSVVKILWPESSSAEAAAWLRDALS